MIHDLPLFSEEQKGIYKKIMNVVVNQNGGVFFYYSAMLDQDKLL